MMIPFLKSGSFIALCMTIVGWQQVIAQQMAIPLYEKQVTDARAAPAGFTEQTDADGRVTGVSQPTLLPYFPRKQHATGTAILIFPGGKRVLSRSILGTLPAQWERSHEKYLPEYFVPSNSLSKLEPIVCLFLLLTNRWTR
ncbi:hypothetical protein [Chitinophaga eiseniae]|uniref:hypothetical protein n=1 Tax=Chitinophaga eiseniae TaxID=634771 RepID=UPI0011774D42|nr:hypothetical protein [Chitinophaga eiseniae]